MKKEIRRVPPEHQMVRDTIEYFKNEYPMLKTFPIGTSVLGREICALSIGNPMNATLFVGATHGMEWLTTTVLLWFCQQVLEGLKTGGSVSDIDLQVALRTRSLVIVPCLNPDGVELVLNGIQSAGEKADFINHISGGDTSHWQANANGVDINHNFDAGWPTLKGMELDAGIDGPGPTRYGGSHAHSEPETMAITGFCMAFQPRALYTFHSQGEEIYYRYGQHTPERSRLMAQILASSSGYKLSMPEGLASHGGLKDWFVEKFRRPGFTIELGKGENPLTLQQFNGIYKKVEEMLILATLL